MATRKREPHERKREGRSAEETPDEREDKSEVEREAEGGMRASVPGLLSSDRVEDLTSEADELEGHQLRGAEGRERASIDAGAPEDIVPEGWTDAELSKRRRAAKDAAKETGTAE